MSLNIITGQGARPRAYSPERDLAHNFASIFQTSCRMLMEKSAWRPILVYLKKQRIDDESLSTALKSLQQFIMTAADYPSETIEDVCKRTGWLDQPANVQLAICATLGAVVCGAYFACVRDAKIGHIDPVDNFGDMMNTSEKVVAVLSGRNKS